MLQLYASETCVKSTHLLTCFDQCFITVNTFINSYPPSAAYMRQWIGPALVQIMDCRLFGAKPLSKPMLGYCQMDTKEQN